MGSADEWAQSPRDHDGLKGDWVKLLVAEVANPNLGYRTCLSTVRHLAFWSRVPALIRIHSGS